MTQEIKAKRKLKDIDFSREDSHIALVHKDQGGCASGANYKLVLKALNKESNPVVKPTVEDTSFEVNEGVSPVVKQTNRETKMDEIVELQKSLATQTEMLTKALDEVNALKAEKQEQVVKSKTAKITEIVKDAGHAKIIAKACLELESEEDFTAFVAAITAMQTTIDKTDMFIEKGLNVDNAEAKPETNHVEKLLKAKYVK